MDVLIMFGLLILILFLIGVLIVSERKPIKHGWQAQVNTELQSLNERANKKEFQNLKSCLIDSDSLLDHVLKERKIEGNTMGDRLKKAKGRFPRDQYEDIWTAHKMRNKLIHEIDFHPSLESIEKDFRTMQKATKSLL